MQKINMKDRFLFVKENDDSYVMFLPPDMESVKMFRMELTSSLIDHIFPTDDIIKIELACDEALTNSISANVANESDETIICRWKISNFRFSLIIMDYGRGVPKEKIDEISGSQSSLANMMNKLRKDQDNTPRVLPFKGVQKKHKNMGQGLRIINNLMDTVRIMYHCPDRILEHPTDDAIDGSILELCFQANKGK